MVGTRGRGKVLPRTSNILACDSSKDAFSSVAQALAHGLDSRPAIASNTAASKGASHSSEDIAAQSRQQIGRCSTSAPSIAAAVACMVGENTHPANINNSTSIVSNQPQHNQPRTPLSAAVTSTLRSSYTQQPWRCALGLVGGSVPELPEKWIGTAKCRLLLSQGQPLLMQGLHLATCRLNSKCTTKQAHARPEQQQHSMLSVLCSPSDVNRFMVADMSKNAPGSYYHLRKPETSVLSMSFQEWLAAWQTWEKSRLLLQAVVCAWEVAQQPASSNGTLAGPKAKIWPNPAIWPHLPQLLTAEISKTGTVAATTTLADGINPTPPVTSLVNWGLLQLLLTAGQYHQQGQLQLIAGGRDALLPAQYHTHDRLICQVSGRQQLLLVPPAQGFTGCYPYPVAHPYDRYSCVDWEEPELQHWPAASQLRGLACELSPGDCLLIPAYWFVHSQLQQPACVSMVLQLQPLPTKLLHPSALLMQLSRMAEVWLAAEVGSANVRHWLMALSEGREWQQLQKQLATVTGYKLLQVCHMIMQQTQQVLSLSWSIHSPAAGFAGSTATKAEPEDHTTGGKHCSEMAGPDSLVGAAKPCKHTVACGTALECRARQILRLMCDERLMPTHWLNQGISDPLYLKHQPQYYLIEEDAEAAKYPALFKHRLIGNRPDWQQHAKQLQLAPPGSGRTLIPRIAWQDGAAEP